ncbi:MAG: hypothetical protein E6I87_03530 [Chloroflexi bacterium]|nr:MAG: hypothetical protein E6I87_03530 [Chloroflexota bacterium]
MELKVGAALGGKVGTVVAMALEGTEVAGGDATGAALDGVDVRGAVAGLDVAVSGVAEDAAALAVRV